MNVYEIITDRILDRLKAGVVPWRQPWRDSTGNTKRRPGGNWPTNLVSGKPYRGCNVFLLAMQGYQSPLWVTYKQAQAKGGQVRKGEKATPVIFWSPVEKTEADGSKRKILLLRYYSVFNVGQCDGLAMPEAPKPEATPEPTEPAFNPIAECEAIVKSYSDAPSLLHGGNRACYMPATDQVFMPEATAFKDREHYYSVLFHELTHSTGHHKRLARKGITALEGFGSHSYSFEELVAECGAAFLCGHAGIETTTLDDSASYIASWMRRLKDEPKWIVEAAGKAAKAADLIRGVRAEATTTEESEA